MNRKEFMEQLRRLLHDMPASEREEALSYYEDYFDDAGIENEASVILELGSPGRIAAEIKAGLQADPNAGEYTDTGYHQKGTNDGSFSNGKKPVKYGQHRQPRKINSMSKGKKILLILILAVLTFPIWSVVFCTAGSVIIGVFGVLLGLTAGSLFGGIGLLIGSIAIIVFSVSTITSSLSLGLVELGLGMITLSMGLLLLVGFGWIVSKAIPALVRFVADLFQKVFHRKREDGVL